MHYHTKIYCHKIIALNMKVFAIIIILCFGIAKIQSEEESYYFDYEPQSAEARYITKNTSKQTFFKIHLNINYDAVKFILKKFCWHNCFIIIYLASASCGVKKCWKDSTRKSAKSKNTVEKVTSFQVDDKRWISIIIDK